MSLHQDLLTQAHYLATRERRRPRQASLRRSVSASYYAVFHLLVDAATRRFVPGNDRGPLRLALRRAFAHRTMKAAAIGFTSGAGNVSEKLRPGLNNLPLQPELTRIAETFSVLQEHRHEADYDLARPFTRFETLNLYYRAERAFTDWRAIRRTPQADTFLVGLFAIDRLRS